MKARALLILFCLAACAVSAAEHWSLQPLVKPSVPAISSNSWVQSPIDAFVLEKLAAQQMHPSPPAHKPVLLRRVYYNLIGLPPSPGELAAFLADNSPEAFSKVVDRLLDRPEYGERWARHWLDVAHYAESHGHDQDRMRTNAWPFRDYVIESFNSDKPFARFLQEQVAGDVMFPDDPAATVAMGFLASGPWDESSMRDIREDSIDRQIARYIDRDDIVATVMNTFSSTTVQCARCHDHKFDPVSQREYYSLQAVFAGTDKGNRYFDRNPNVHQRRQELLRRQEALETDSRELRQELLGPDFQNQVRAWEAEAQKRFAVWTSLSPSTPFFLLKSLLPANPSEEHRFLLARFIARERIKSDLASLPPPSIVYAGALRFIPDEGHKPAKAARPVHLLKRGEINRPGEPALPAALSFQPHLPGQFKLDAQSEEGERRKALALWLSDPRNGLTWRSIVNRVWHYHFGRGLVTTPNDFGKMGSTPTHPELLDWLATWFIENGGRFKDLHRLILNSAVYQQSSRDHPDFSRRDAENAFLWRMNRARLDAEAVRDSILAVSGKLDRRMGGPSDQNFHLKPGIHVTPEVNYATFDPDAPATQRRGIYRFVFRTLPDPLMDALDCPDPSQLTPVRNNSITVGQALALWNDQFTLRYSEHLADRLNAAAPTDLPRQIDLAIRLLFARPPAPAETARLAAFARNHGLPALCRVLLNSNEFMFVN